VKGVAEVVSWRWGRSLWRMTFLRILDRNGRLEMGSSFSKDFLSDDNLFSFLFNVHSDTVIFILG